MQLNDTKTSASLDLSGIFSTTALERLIGELLVLRAHMAPPVPYDPPRAGDPSTEAAHVSVQSDPYFHLGRRRDGGLRLWLRHQGLGWMVYDIPAAKTRGVVDYLNSVSGDEGPGHTLFGEEDGKQH